MQEGGLPPAADTPHPVYGDAFAAAQPRPHRRRPFVGGHYGPGKRVVRVYLWDEVRTRAIDLRGAPTTRPKRVVDAAGREVDTAVSLPEYAVRLLR